MNPQSNGVVFALASAVFAALTLTWQAALGAAMIVAGSLIMVLF